MAEISPALEAETLPGEARLQRRARIADLQDHMLALNEARPEVKVEPETLHHFAGGVYVREMRVPAGTLVIGKIHKLPHVTMLMQGKITITTEEGSQTLEAPRTLVAEPGIKRVGYAHTDVIWHSIHHVGEVRDLDCIEEMLIAKDFDDPALAPQPPTKRIEEAA